MALKPVQDPNLLAALNAPEQAPAPAPTGPKPVTDPALLAQLNAPAETPMEDTIPQPPSATPAPVTETPEPSIWEKFKSTVGGMAQTVADDPIVQMWSDAIPKVIKGAPEVAMNTIGNTGVQIAGGLGGLMLGQDDNDSANFIRDFTAEHSMQPQGDSARELTGAIGEAFDPLQNIKSTLGETTLDATGSPLAALGADMLPDLGLALTGGEGAAARGAELPKQALKADRVVNPKVTDLRAADIRLRPSDVRAMTPGAKKVPGEFRERFADAPELKKDMTLHNQQRYTDIASKEIGTKDLTDKSLDTAETPHIEKYQLAEDVIRELPAEKAVPEFVEAYREAASSAKLPKGEDSGVTRVIGALRRRAATRARSNDVKTEEAGYADRELADRLEEQFGKQLEAAGEPQLLKEYQDAREALAKIHDVRMSTRADQIDASKLYQLNQKSEGRRLTGGLKLIADASEYAPNVSKHSLTTAARAGGEIEGSKEGLIKGLAKSALRKVPGMDVGSEGFQNSLGKADEARTSYYGRDPDIAPPRGPEQPGLDLREALQLEAPPGEVGKAPRAPRQFGPQADAFGNEFEFQMPQGEVGKAPRAPRQFGPQADAFGNEFEFQMPQGEVGVPPPAPMSLQDILGLGEPLDLTKSPGRVGKPKRKP